MRKPEILAPAGNLEKLKIAIDFGADAVYIGGGKLNLRAFSNNFSNEEMLEGKGGIVVPVGDVAFLEDALELDSGGYIVADESTKTSIDGVFAVGDVRTKQVRQVVTAVADGASAVHYAEEYLAEKLI